MRQSLALTLVIIHLFGNTEMGQVFRLPKLVSHFCQHHRLDPGLTFSEFLQMHYSGDDGTTADDDIDSQLPFHNLAQNTVSVMYSPMVMETQALGCPLEPSRTYYGHMPKFIPSKHVLMILQPPRFS